MTPNPNPDHECDNHNRADAAYFADKRRVRWMVLGYLAAVVIVRAVRVMGRVLKGDEMSDLHEYIESHGYKIASMGGGRGLFTYHLVDVGRRIGEPNGANGTYEGYKFEAGSKTEVEQAIREWVDSQPPLHWVHEPPEKIFGLWYQWGIDGQRHVIEGES